MNSLFIVLVSVAAASALTVIAPHTGGLGGLGQAAGAPAANTQGAAAGGVGAAGGAANLGYVDYGVKVYGMGAKNRFALPPNPFLIQRAVAIANSMPNVLVRLDINGEVTLTNQFGQEIDVVDAFGREIEFEF